jgi:hypothetical protein
MRKPRPLNRDLATYRDDRLFIVATDDTYAPAQYFAQFRMPRVQIHVVPSEDGKASANHVLDRLLKIDHEPDDERWLLLDTDHYTQPNHIAGFLATIKEARRQGVSVGVSRPCFELWLALHHLDPADVGGEKLPDARAFEEALRTRLGSYNKRNLRAGDFPLSLLSVAIERAIAIDTEGDLPTRNATRVYRLCQAVRESSGCG